jgi:hypothetical protein
MRRATCSCGALSIETRGEPARVLICSCTQCQKRTGSVYGVSAYFREADIASRTGAASVFTRKGESGKTLTFNFCPVCGSSLHWTAELLPGLVGVACGAFEAGDALPDPDGAFWLQHKADWVPMPDDIPGHPTTPSRAQGVGTAPAAAGGEAAQAGE